jgi:hypothetical protein
MKLARISSASTIDLGKSTKLDQPRLVEIQA